MEKCKKVCKDVRPSGEDDHGNKYFWIDFEDKSSGLFGCKEQDLFQVGQESEFYFEPKVGKGNKEYNKIRRVSSVEYDDGNTEKKSSTPLISGSGNVKSKEVNDMINRSVAIKAICELRQGSSIQPINIIEEAEILFDYIQFGVGGSDRVTNEGPQKKDIMPTDGTGVEEPDNGLPF